LEYSLHDALRAGFEQAVFIIRRDMEDDFRKKLSSRFEHKINCSYAFQELCDIPSEFTVPKEREKPWGTGHAVRSARDLVHSNFAVINADDYYGPDAYSQLATFLKKNTREDLFALVGYRLRNTLSEHGSVSRGVCQLSDGEFDGVTEMHGIAQSGDTIKSADSSVSFTGNELVSMNLWGFTPNAFHLLETGLREFLEKNVGDPASEFYLPACINDAVASGKADIQLINTEERWFGLTYLEDRERVQAEILSKIEKGIYPEKLWA